MNFLLLFSRIFKTNFLRFYITLGSLLITNSLVAWNASANTLSESAEIAIQSLSVTSTPVEAVISGGNYNYQIQTNAVGAVTYTVVQKPAWLNFDAVQGLLTGSSLAIVANQPVNIQITADGQTINHTFNISVKPVYSAPKIITKYVDPTQYPQYQQRKYLTPTWNTFKDTVQFVAGRFATSRKWQDLFTTTSEPIVPLWWTDHGTVFRPNLGWFNETMDDVNQDTAFLGALQQMKDEGIYLFNIGGYGPGSPQAGSSGFGMFSIPEEYNNSLQNILGDQYLGFDVGEQDGRYLNDLNGGSFVNNPDRFQQYLNIHRYLKRAGNDQGNKMVLLTVAWDWHYPAKNNNVYMLGAESQPKSTVTSHSINYMMLRGAARQYGLLLFGDVSIFSSYGSDLTGFSKSYGTPGTNHGPTVGNSLSLMRRLIVSQYLYNSAILGFEGNLFTGDWPPTTTPSPIGEIHNQMFDFVQQHPKAGVMHAPVAVLQNYLSGWIPKRQPTAYNNINGTLERPTTSFGNIPWNYGDWQTHNVVNKIYPNYEYNGWDNKETGGYCDTPYGDMADGLLTDASLEVLNQYGLIISTSQWDGNVDQEVRDKVRAYVEQGGNLILTARNGQDLFPEWIPNDNWLTRQNPNVIYYDGANWSNFNDGGSYLLADNLSLPVHSIRAYSLVNGEVKPVVVDIKLGQGSIKLILSEYGLDTGNGEPTNLEHFSRILDEELNKQRLFSVGNSQLAYITNRIDNDTYTVTVFNNSLDPKDFSISSPIGTINQITELDLTAGRTHVRNEQGYWPRNYQSNDGGINTSSIIAGGDVRMFQVNVTFTEATNEVTQLDYASHPTNRYLYIPDIEGAEEYLLNWKSFFEHFEGVMIDWTTLANKDKDQLTKAATWLNIQNLKVVVDFSRGFNDYLQIMAQQNGNQELETTITNTFDKMTAIFGTNSTNAIIKIENTAVTDNQLLEAINIIAGIAQNKGVTLNLYPGESTDNNSILTLVDDLNVQKSKPNVKYLLETTKVPDIGTGISNGGTKLNAIMITPETLQKNYSALQSINPSVLQILNANYATWDWNSIYNTVTSIYEENNPVTLTGSIDKPELFDISGAINDNKKVHSANANRYLTLREIQDVRKEILDLGDTFFCHFGGVMVESKYLANRDDDLLANDKRWLQSKGINIIVDFSLEINKFPGLTLFQHANNTPQHETYPSNYQRTVENNAYIDKVLDKCGLIGANDVIVGGHTGPEILGAIKTAPNYAHLIPEINQTTGIRRLTQQAQNRGIKVHYQNNEYNNGADGHLYNSAPNVKNIVTSLRGEGLTNLHFASNTLNIKDTSHSIPSTIGAIILGGSPSDDFRSPTPIHVVQFPIGWLAPHSNIPQILDGGYEVIAPQFRVSNIINDVNYMGWGMQCNPNHKPTINSTPNLTVNENDNYTYTIQATDADNNSLTYSANFLPSWLSFDPATRILSGTVPAGSSGASFLVKLRVSDGTTDVEQEFLITVNNTAKFAGKDKLENTLSKIVVYPNPSKGIFTIVTPVGSNSIDNIEVVDLQGRIVQNINQPKLQNQEYHVSLKNISVGIYTLRLVKNNNTIDAHKIVIEK